MFEGLLLLSYSIFRTTAEVCSKLNFTLLKYVKSERSYGFLITEELIFGFQILDLKDYFLASLAGANNRPRSSLLQRNYVTCHITLLVN